MSPPVMKKNALGPRVCSSSGGSIFSSFSHPLESDAPGPAAVFVYKDVPQVKLGSPFLICHFVP